MIWCFQSYYSLNALATEFVGSTHFVVVFSYCSLLLELMSVSEKINKLSNLSIYHQIQRSHSDISLYTSSGEGILII